MTTMRDLLRERASLRDQLTKLDAAHPDGSLPEAEQRQWDDASARMDGMEARITRQAVLDAADRTIAGAPLPGTEDRSWNSMMSRYSLSRAILGCCPTSSGAPPIDAALEREVSQEMSKRIGREPHNIWVPDSVFARPAVERRATGGGTGQVVSDETFGGALVFPGYRPDMYIDPLVSASILPRLGATVLSNLPETVVIPKQLTKLSAFWVNENENINESGLTFGTIELKARVVGAVMRYSRKLLSYGLPSIDALLRSDVERQIGIAIDTAALTGNGVTEPLGLLNRTDIPVYTQAADGGFLNFADIYAISNAPGLLNADVGGGNAWLTNGNVISALQQTTDLQGRPLEMMQSLPASLVGDMVVRSQTVPHNLSKGASTGILSALIYGAWSQLIVARFLGATDLLIDPFTYASSLQIRMIAYQSIDVNCRHPESFLVAKAIKTA